MIVQVKLPSQAGEAKVGDLVYQGDVVRTVADGRVSINFTDGTSFNLTNNANMTLNEFVYDPNGKSNSTLFNLSKGTFTFVAGKVAKTGDMKVTTPVPTMGIEVRRRTWKSRMQGQSNFPPFLKRERVSLRKGHLRPGNPNKKPNKRRI